LARPVVERTGAGACAPEVEAKHGAPDAAERLCRLIDDLRVHRPAVLGVRMAEDDRCAHAAGVADADAAVRSHGAGRYRFIQQRFEPSRRSLKLTERHQATLSGRRRLAAMNSRTTSVNASGRVMLPR